MGSRGRLAALRRQPGSGTTRVEPGAKQSVADVDIAQAGDNTLVHQEGFKIRFSADRPVRQIGGIERLAERLDAEAAEEGVALEILLGDQGHVAKSAHVVVGYHHATR